MEVKVVKFGINYRVILPSGYIQHWHGTEDGFQSYLSRHGFKVAEFTDLYM